VRIFENRGWKLPPELKMSEPEEELTFIKAIKTYLEADERHSRERNAYAIDRLVEYFGDNCPLGEIKVPQIRRYRKSRLEKVQNATVNREISALSGIFKVQIEWENVDSNPCRMIDRLPESQRDNYVSWEDFNRLLKHSWWLREIITTMYYTGMRFGEVANLRWEMFKPDRRMLVLPPSATKEGKSVKKAKVSSKRVPLRKEVMELLESLRKGDGENVIRATGLIFSYSGRYINHCGTNQGKPVNRSMVRKAWKRAIGLAGLEGLQIRDIRHTWKTNAQRSGIDPTIRNAIVGHSSQRPVEDRYIKVSDEELLKAVDSMTFDNGWTELDMVEEGGG
jgi:integrase